MPASSCDVFFSFCIRLIRRPSPPRPIGLVEPTLLLDREGFDVLRCCCPTVLDVRSHGPRPHGRSRVTLLVLAVLAPAAIDADAAPATSTAPRIRVERSSMVVTYKRRIERATGRAGRATDGRQ